MSRAINVFDELIGLKLQFDELMVSLTQTESGASVCNGVYAHLKNSVKTRRDELSRKKTLSFEEQSFLLPALKEVELHCVARSNSKNRQELISSVYDAQDYLSYYINQRT
ncbi:hypothetical protein [Vibrio parahaemolyticus]|uniref:hypothetical protein n=1 Tax=Vibrio parahaemolyticus TaxID=670 RepID=UPI00041AA12C|nr:hypothetical protein [Vibrio parahaemolyticus]